MKRRNRRNFSSALTLLLSAALLCQSGVPVYAAESGWTEELTDGWAETDFTDGLTGAEVAGAEEEQTAEPESVEAEPVSALPETDASCFNFTFSGETAKITGYTGSDAEISIPGKVTKDSKTYTVTAIGMKAFNGNKSLKCVIIPDSVTSVDNYVFSGCTSLTDVTIGSGVTSISDGMFKNCTALTNILSG